jgi:hypothetical protein
MYHEWAPIGLHEEQETSILKGEEFLGNHAEFIYSLEEIATDL